MDSRGARRDGVVRHGDNGANRPLRPMSTRRPARAGTWLPRTLAVAPVGASLRPGSLLENPPVARQATSGYGRGLLQEKSLHLVLRAQIRPAKTLLFPAADAPSIPAGRLLMG